MVSVLPSADWLDVLTPALRAQLQALQAQLAAAEAAGEQVLPAAHQRFAALDAVAPDAVRVVIVGQDPYPTPGNAHGLAFSVQPGTRLPASLRNIFKEIEADTGQASMCAADGNLRPWAEQGVLLLNTTLTVRAGAAGSHEKLGWQALTSAWLRAAAERNPAAVFLLWGGHAQKLAAVLPAQTVRLESVHPSPLSAYRGFFGCRHFSRANAALLAAGKPAIRW